ncbi:hypothetical protein ARMSODRAFT_1013582 [Armillaria solidipes]|uniref:Uncharacterized protein n=1 Tax=Armillaria solidipes TaxID=1076256 RepID=A0A2H3BUR0_9AGAR|nr:hypothetical protein ARMSODRAFT_1013582 [Armillaria solidipes]
MAKTKKLLALPPTMAAASHMNTCLKNKDQHPGVVDDWEKKTQNVAVQKQQEKGKVQVAIIEDKMRREDMARELTANHPTVTVRAAKTVIVGTKGSITVMENESPASSSKEPESIAAESKANNSTLSEESGKDSSAYEPDAIQEEEVSLEGEVQPEDKGADSHVTTVTAKKTATKGKKNKTTVRSSIASLCATNNAIGTPSIKRKAEEDCYDFSIFPYLISSAYLISSYRGAYSIITDIGLVATTPSGDLSICTTARDHRSPYSLFSLFHA